MTFVAAVWCHDHKVHIFPTTNKKPAVPEGTSWKDYRCTREQAARFREYGLPLGVREGYDDGLTVVDADSAATHAWAVAHLPATPFMVTTGPHHDGSPGRGLHLYFRTRTKLPSSIHRDGVSLENRNAGAYVVGPGSRRPDGVVYTPSDWSWRWDDIPFFPADFLFDDGSCGTVSRSGEPLRLPAEIKSERHKTLQRLVRSLATHGVPLDGALTVCRLENSTRCRPPLDDLEELDDCLSRAYKQKDRDGFVRSPKTGWLLAGALLEVGLSVEVTLVAVRSVTPDFDPERS